MFYSFSTQSSTSHFSTLLWDTWIVQALAKLLAFMAKRFHVCNLLFLLVLFLPQWWFLLCWLWPAYLPSCMQLSFLWFFYKFYFYDFLFLYIIYYLLFFIYYLFLLMYFFGLFVFSLLVFIYFIFIFIYFYMVCVFIFIIRIRDVHYCKHQLFCRTDSRLLVLFLIAKTLLSFARHILEIMLRPLPSRTQ